MKPLAEALPLPEIPQKRYFAISEVSELCGVKAHVLRYWEQEFQQLKPIKRRGNRRYYQHEDILMVRRIRELLYEQGFTIGGARLKLRGHQAEEPTSPESAVVRSEFPVPRPQTQVQSSALKQIRGELESLLARWPA